MSRKESLESSEFYKKRYSNVATAIVLPVILLVLVILLFSLFAKKEIVAERSGVIVPAQTLAVVQMPQSSKLIVNHLSEGKKVKKGQVLVKLESSLEKTNIDSLRQKEIDLQNRIIGLDSLEQGILTTSNTIPEPDAFGYHWILQEYLNKVQPLNYQLSKAHSSSDKQTINDQIENLQTEQLSNVAKLKDEIKQTLRDTNNSKKTASIKYNDSTLKSPATGVIHVENELEKNKTVPAGSNIATIIPTNRSKVPFKLTALIKVNQIAGVKKGQKVRFNVSGNDYINSSIPGTIQNISSSPELSDKAPVYKVSIKLNPSRKIEKDLRYGMTGKVSIIIEKKTYFDIYKHRLLH